MTEKSPNIVIIGSGIGGLSAGCYAQMNGFRSEIYEQHNIPGGVCTGWRRKGYTFDGCIHHLAGCTPGSKVYKMWAELGAMPREIHYPEDLICIEGPDGRRFTVYTDLDRLERHMLELSPVDSGVIHEFIGAARQLTDLNLMELLLAKPWEMLAMLPKAGLLSKWGKLTLDQLGARFQDPFLRRAIPMIQYDFPNIPAVVALMFLSGVHTRYLGFPKGGALEFARSLEQRYKTLGGTVHYRARVQDILVEPGPRGKDRAAGICLEDGREVRSDAVISNADGRTTIYGMLNGKYMNDLIEGFYQNPPLRQEMALHVSLGVARDFSGEPHGLVLCLPEPVEICNETVDRLDLEIYSFAPEFAPPGKTAVKANFISSYDYWKKLRDEGEEVYDGAKRCVAESVITALDRRFPGLQSQVETVDVATPLTTERFTGSYHGYQAWGIPNQGLVDAMSGKGLSKTLPGLDDFYMVGQWAGGLGLPNVATMGRKTIEGLCKREGRRFKAST